MSLLPTTKADLLRLLEQAHSAGSQKEVLLRLGWFLHFVEHGSISNTCRHFNIARTTFYRWVRRFDPANLESLADAPEVVPVYHRPSQFLAIQPSVGTAADTREPVQPAATDRAHRCVLCLLRESFVHHWTLLVLACALAGLSILSAIAPAALRAAFPAEVSATIVSGPAACPEPVSRLRP